MKVGWGTVALRLEVSGGSRREDGGKETKALTDENVEIERENGGLGSWAELPETSCFDIVCCGSCFSRGTDKGIKQLCVGWWENETTTVFSPTAVRDVSLSLLPLLSLPFCKSSACLLPLPSFLILLHYILIWFILYFIIFLIFNSFIFFRYLWKYIFILILFLFFISNYWTNSFLLYFLNIHFKPF